MIRLLVMLTISITSYSIPAQTTLLGPSQSIRLSDHHTILDLRPLAQQIYAMDRGESVPIVDCRLIPDGVSLDYSNIMDEDFVAAYPKIRVYTWNHSENHGVVTSNGDLTFITIYDENGITSYIPSVTHHNLYHMSNSADIEPHDHNCALQPTRAELERVAYIQDRVTSRDLVENGSVLRRYRLAPIATGEYFQANGGTNGSVSVHLTNSIANIEAIFKKEIGVYFTMLTPVLFPDPNTDPFTPDMAGGDPRTQQAQDEISAQFNSASYDLGHVFHHTEEDDGWSTGGVAGLGVVCRSQNDAKARGWSGSFNNNNVSWYQLAAHEFGHMFSATHTFNGSGESCEDAISDDTAYEIGSGTTIMSYQGICEDGQNITSSGAADSYFHAHSLIQMIGYMETFGDCANEGNSNNQPPVIDINPCNLAYEIPRGTPFIMSAEASDPDGDELTYVWEQYDEDGPGDTHPTQGFIGTMAAASPIAPLFRSFPPSPDISRSFPLLSTVVDGNSSDPFQVLPGTSRTLHFKLSARDNDPIAGGVAIEDREVEVINGGPFRVVAPNTNVTVTAGNPLEVQWSTGNSNSVCDQVDIMLSVDGGVSFPYLLGNNIDYSDESAMINIPISLTATTEARIMIICDDNPCLQIFDISNTNFEIESDCEASSSYLCDTEGIVANQGDASLNLDLSSIRGTIVNDFSRTITDASPIMNMSAYNDNLSGCRNITTYFYESIEVSPTVSGTYQFNLDVNADDGTGFITVYESAGLNLDDPCPRFVGSSAINTMGTSIIPTGSAIVDLEACVDYTITLHNYGSFPVNTVVTSISGPGQILTDINPQLPNYDYIYAALDVSNGTVAAVSTTGDFTTLSGGIYDVYGISYKASGPEPPNNTDPNNWVGVALNQLIFTGNCILQSQNAKRIQILSTCTIDNVEIGSQSTCDPMDNTYDQDIVITYDGAPFSGNLIINGASFPLTSPPQGVILQDLLADGMPVDLTISFSEDMSCETIFPAAFTAPENCCPIDLDLGDDISACTDDGITLDAGPDGITYEWQIDGAPTAFVTQIITPEVSGVYSVTVTNADGCAKSDEVAITLSTNPTFNLPDNSSACEGQLATLDPMIGNSSFTYEWSRDGSFVAGSEVIEVSIPGEYCLVVTDVASGCTAEDCTTVNFVDAPDVDLGDDISGCQGDMILLDAGSDGTSYTWTLDGVPLPDVTAQIDATISGEYIVTVAEGTCSTNDTIQVMLIDPPTVDITPYNESFSLCIGDAYDLMLEGSYDEVTWYLNDIEISNAEQISVSVAGQYVVIATLGNGCTDSDTLDAIGIEPPSVDLGEDIIACIGSEVLLDAGEGDNYEYSWFKDDVVLPNNESTLSVTESGQYVAWVNSDPLCSTQDTINVDFQPGPTLDLGADFSLCDGESQIITANTNGDNIIWLKDGISLMNDDVFTLEVNSTGIYTAIVMGDTGCTVEEQISVTVFDIPEIDLTPSTTICEGDEATITAGPDTQDYIWTDEDGNTVSTTETLISSIAGTYTLVVTNNNDCTTSAQIEILTTSLPDISLPAEGGYCEGETTIIDAGGMAESYSWTLDMSTIPGANSASLEVSAPGSYTVTASNGDQCSTEATIQMTEYTRPTFELGDDIELCPSESTTLTIDATGTYLWSDGQTTATITVAYDDLLDTETIYTAQVTDDNGCTASDEISITRLTQPDPIIDEEAIVCEGDTITLQVTASDGTPTDEYQWSGPDGTFSSSVGSSIMVFPDDDAIYTVTVVNGCGISSNSADIMVFIDSPASDLSAGRDTCVIEGQSIRLAATGGVSYIWQDDGTFVGSTTIATPEVMPTTETSYSVTITNDNGCQYTDEVTICIIEDPFALLKPINMITPNDDGMNDALIFNGLEAFPDNRLRVYNRWGSVIFDRDGYQNGEILFDGTRRGELLPADTYYYILEIDGEIVFKSDLTIIRN